MIENHSIIIVFIAEYGMIVKIGKRALCCFFLAPFFFIFFTFPLSARPWDEGLTVNAMGIVSPVLGDFASHLGTGGGVDLGFYYHLPWLNRNLLAGGDLVYQHWGLSHSKKSSMLYAGFGGFLEYMYPVHRYFNPFAGASVRGVFLSLDTDNLGKKENTFKPGGGIRCGMQSDIWAGFGLRVMYEYNMLPLSGRLFQTASVSMGVTFNLQGWKSRGHAGDQPDMPVDVNALYSQGQSHMEAGSLDRAEELFRKVLEQEPSHAPAARSLEQVSSVRSLHEQTRSLVSQGRNLEAIPNMEQCARYYPEDRSDLERIRSQYTREIPAWEQTAISAYDRKDYNTCIMVMQKILLVEPDNQTVKIYLPRAQKRQKALERLE